MISSNSIFCALLSAILLALIASMQVRGEDVTSNNEANESSPTPKRALRSESEESEPNLSLLITSNLRRNVRQDTYNFYNIRPPYNRPRPRPTYNDYYNYDDAAEYVPNYRPPYRPYPPYPYQPYPSPYPRPPSTTTSTTTTPPPSSPIAPIGYMLIDTYNGPSGSYSKPIAFFRN